MPPRGSAALVGAGLRNALGHDVVVPLPLATIRRPDIPLKGKPETGGAAGAETLQVPGLGHQVSGSGIQVQIQVPGLFP